MNRNRIRDKRYEKTLPVSGLFLIIAATAALAYQGVQNPTVKARMDAMSAIGKNTKVLGAIAKGQVAFDATTAKAAAGAIADHAAQISALFQEPATDPKSEAQPVI
ncbi:MAG: cytochrome c556 [Paracoccaceae bacterium]|jgi:cytochrome c556